MSVPKAFNHRMRSFRTHCVCRTVPFLNSMFAMHHGKSSVDWSFLSITSLITLSLKNNYFYLELKCGKYCLKWARHSFHFHQLIIQAWFSIFRCWSFPRWSIYFSIRADSFDPVELGYRTKFEEMEKAGRWSLVNREQRELYTHPHDESIRNCYLITYKVLNNWSTLLKQLVDT